MKISRVIILLILVSILASIITAVLIINANINNSIKEVITSGDEIDIKPKEKVELYKEYHLPKKDGVKGAKYMDSYKENPLVWEKVLYESDKIFGYYYQISGLKDKEVQSNINNKLKSSFINFCNDKYKLITSKEEHDYYDISFKVYVNDEIIDIYEYEYNHDGKYSSKTWKLFVDQFIVSNFSNVISVATGSFDSKNDMGYIYGRKYDSFVNVDLNTGNDIQIEDLFTEDVDMLSIVKELFYTKLPIYNSYKYDEEYERYGDNEEDVWSYPINERYEEVDVEKFEKIVKTFRYKKDIDFCFSPRNFIIRIDDYMVEKDFIELLGKIAIYSRFDLGKDLYENQENTNTYKCYKEYVLDNTIKKAVYANDDDIYYCYQLTYADYKDTPEKNDILNKAKKVLDDTIKEEIKNLRKLKSENEIIYFEHNFNIEEAYTKNEEGIYGVSKPVSDNVMNLIDQDKKFFCIESNYNDYYKMTKEEFRDGTFERYILISNILYDNNEKYYPEYKDLNERFSLNDSYGKLMGYEYTYKYLTKIYENRFYKVEDSKYFENEKDLIKYILKDGSEEGFNNFIDVLSVAIKEKVKSNYSEFSSKNAESISKDNYRIENNMVYFDYYDYKYNYRATTNFSYIKKEYSYLYMPYPAKEFNGVT